MTDRKFVQGEGIMCRRLKRDDNRAIVRMLVAGVVMSIASLAFFFGGLAQARSTARPSVVRETDVTTTGVIGPNATATFVTTCPHSYPHAVGGEFAAPQGDSPAALVLAESAPHGQQGWVVTVRNLIGETQSYYAAIVCLRARATFAYPRTRFEITPNGGISNNFSAPCPKRARHPINVYFGTSSAADTGNAVLSDSYEARGINATLIDLSNGPIGAFGGAVCTSLRMSYATTPVETVPANTGAGWTFTCPHRTHAVTGWVFPTSYTDAGLLEPSTTALYKNAHKWTLSFTNPTQHSVRYYAGAVCI